MPVVYADNVKESHMRFEFTDAVVSVPLAEDATFQDVALICRDLTRKCHGDLVSIVVVLAAEKAQSADSVTAQPSLAPQPDAELARL